MKMGNSNTNQNPRANGNVMLGIKLDKVVLNIAVGNDEAKLLRAIKLLEMITERRPTQNLSKKRIAAWKIRKGLPIGARVTLRKNKAEEVLARLLEAIDHKLSERQFTDSGFSFGIKEYIQIPGIPYQRELGMLGLDVTAAFKRAGYRAGQRKIKTGKVPRRQRATRDEILEYARKNFKINFEEN